MLTRFSRGDDFRSFYRENGFVVLSDLYTPEELQAARRDVESLFNARFRALGYEDGDFERSLVERYDDARDAWREAAHRMWDLFGVFSLAAKAAVRDVLIELGMDGPMISTRPEVRTDMPGDDRYMQPWHQDWRYGQGSVNSVTFWIPLHDVSVENGTIDVMPGTHLLGVLENEELQDPRRFSVTDPRIDGLASEPAELSFGETIAFSQLLVHRSGHNQSGSPRLTIQSRFTDFAEPLALRNGLRVASGSELVWDAPPSEADARAAFASLG